MPEFLGLKYTANLRVASDVTEAAADTQDLHTIVVSNGAQRWRLFVEFEPTVPVLSGAAAAELVAHQLAHGWVEPFDLPMPQDAEVEAGQRTATGDAGADTVVITGLPLPTGAFISFAGDTKVYLTTDDAGGITPPLRVELTDAAVDVTPMLHCRYARSGEIGFGTDRRGVLRLRRTFVEAL